MPHDEHKPDWPIHAILGFTCAALFAIGISAAHLRTDEADSYLFAHYADRLLHGQRLYVDLWDNKPPGIFWANALGLLLGGGHYGGIIALCAASSAASLGLIFVIGRRWFSPVAAALGTTLAALYLLHQMYRGGTNRPETFVVLFDLAAVYFYQTALRRPRAALWCICGTMAACSLVFKQTGFAAGVAIVLHRLYTGWRTKQYTARLREARFIILGSVAALGIALVVLSLTGDLGWAWDAVILFVVRYQASHVGSRPAGYFFGLSDHLHVLALPLILALSGIVYLLAGRIHTLRFGGIETSRIETNEFAGFLLLWLTSAVLLAFGGPGRSYHYLPTAFAPLLMLATFSIDRIIAQRREHPHLPPLVLRYVAALWLVYMGLDPTRQQIRSLASGFEARIGQEDPFGDRSIIEFVEQFTLTDEAVFLWDYLPHVHQATGRPSASRFYSLIYAEQLGPAGQYVIDDILTSFQTRPPKLVLLTLRKARQLRDAQPVGGLDLRRLAAFLCERYRPIVPGNLDSVLILML